MYDTFPPNWASVIRDWAGTKSRISRIFVFGSRAKGNARPTSDLDIGVLISGEDPDERLLYTMDNTNNWKSELNALLPVSVDLQFAEPVSDYVVWPAIQDHGILVYQATRAE